MANFEITGLEKLNKNIEHLTKSMSPKQLEDASMSSAEIMRNEIERRAPRGPTGNLKRSIVKKALDRKPWGASVIAAVDRKVAPHAHLVEYGTSRSKANPFFRKSVEATAGKAAKRFKSNIKTMIDEAVK